MMSEELLEKALIPKDDVQEDLAAELLTTKSKKKKKLSGHNVPIIVEIAKKTKKNEPRVFPFLVMVDKEAFPASDWG